MSKEQLWEYLKADRTHTPYTASIHFGVSIEEIYRVLKND